MLIRPLPVQTTQEQDLTVRLQQAEQRRASDRALREISARCPSIAGDAALLLARILTESAGSIPPFERGPEEEA